MKDIFISFSANETEKAMKTCEFLEANGFSCFISTRDMSAGREYAGQLFDNIDNSRMVLLLLTKAANTSPHVMREIEYAVRKKIPVLVYALEEVELSKSMEYFLMTIQWVTPQNNADQKLLEGISNTISTKMPQKIQTEKKSFPIIPVAAIAMVILLIAVALLPRSNKNQETAESTAAQATTASAAATDSEEKQSSKAEPSKEADTSENAETTKAAETHQSTYRSGDLITFGSYYNVPLSWMVIDASEDGTLTLLTEEIISIKAYDVAEGGQYNEYDGKSYWTAKPDEITDPQLQINIRGNNDWSVSNIRTWLNSSEKNVIYKDQAPTKKAADLNPYDDEPGFLYGFSDEERSKLIPVENKTTGNSLSNDGKGGDVITEDYVYLPSSAELEKMIADKLSPYANPSALCQEHDENIAYYKSIADSYNTKSYYYLLRDNAGDSAYKVYAAVPQIGNDDNYTTVSAGTGSFGIRPVIKIKLS